MVDMIAPLNSLPHCLSCIISKTAFVLSFPRYCRNIRLLTAMSALFFSFPLSIIQNVPSGRATLLRGVAVKLKHKHLLTLEINTLGLGFCFKLGDDNRKTYEVLKENEVKVAGGLH